MSGVGLITEDHIFKVHYAMGIFILAGFNFANLLGFALSIESVATSQPLPTLTNFLTMYIPILIGVVFIFIQLGRFKMEVTANGWFESSGMDAFMLGHVLAIINVNYILK